MNSRQLILSLFVIGGVGLISLVVIDAAFRARANSLTAFTNYQPSWDDALRAPVEHRAVDVLGRLLVQPQDDPELAMAALIVIRSSQSWAAMAPQIHSQLRAVMDVRLQDKFVSMAAIRPVYDLLDASEYPEIEIYHERIIALSGDRKPLVAALQEAVVKLQMSEEAKADEVLNQLDQAWIALRQPIDGYELNWLAQEMSTIAGVELQAGTALDRYIRRLLEPFGISKDAQYGQSIPDQAMIEWLDRQAQVVVASNPVARDRLHHAVDILRRHHADDVHDPVIAIAVAIASRHHQVPLSGILIGLFTLMSLVGGILYTVIRLRRGPTLIDVNAETMQNVEPIDLDTDAETRSRSSASITDVG
jgi:hypothetical protein